MILKFCVAFRYKSRQRPHLVAAMLDFVKKKDRSFSVIES